MILLLLIWCDLECIVGEVGMLLLVKGVFIVEDVVFVCEYGVVGIVVFNHGGC